MTEHTNAWWDMKEQTSLVEQNKLACWDSIRTKRSIKRRVQEGIGIDFPEETVNMIQSKHIWKLMNLLSTYVRKDQNILD